MSKVSVIIPIYNAEKHIEKCINSIISQTLKDIEIICVNDGCTDSTLNILKKYASCDSRIKIVNKENGGYSSALNAGLEIAVGEYVGIVDSDDYIGDNYYEELYKTAKRHDADISATDMVYMVKDGDFCKRPCGFSSKEKVITSLEKRGKIITTTGATWNKIYKTNFLNKNNIRFKTFKSVAEDNYFTIQCVFLANKISINHKAKYYYVQHNSAWTKTLVGEKGFNVFDVYKHVEERIKEHKLQNENEILKYINKRKIIDFETNYKILLDDYKEKYRNIANTTTNPEIIISLTSYPARINVVHRAIETLLNQNAKVDKIVLWLSEEEFPQKEKDLPVELIKLAKENLVFEIDWCENIKSYKKIIPALRKYPNTVIITADDDILYEQDRVKSLIKTHLKHPKDIICHRGHYILKDFKGNIKPYKKWKHNYNSMFASYNILQTGAGMVLYPLNCFYKDVLNKELFELLAPNADDIWLWAMCVLNKTKIRVAKNNISNLNCIDGTQEVGLYLQNLNCNQNDVVLKKVFEKYPKISEIMTNNFLSKIFKKIGSLNEN